MSEQATSNDRSTRLGRFRSRGPTPGAAGPTGTDVDALTGLPGRSPLHEWLAEATATSRPTSSRSVLAFVDLDSLRDVNDSFGPDAGDGVLTQVAGRLSSTGGRALRYGGAEFAVVFAGIDSMTAPAQIGEYLLSSIGAPFTIAESHAPVTLACHVGLAIGGDASGSAAELVRDAHQALVQARDLGPSSYVVHDESRRARYATRIDESRLQSALDNNEFLLHYQPILRTDSGELIGVEALLRWQEPGATNTGMRFPHDFLPLLEKSGLIVPVGRWVLEETCRQAVAWTEAHPQVAPLFVTCNVGARQLAMPDFPDTVLTALATTGLAARQLCLDITEETLRYNGSHTWSALRRLKEAGVKLGLDDFGTGASGLAALRDLNLDIVRIDRLFIDDLASSPESQAIVRHVVNLAHELDMVVIAEGIEDEEQAATLGPLGVDLAQGFLYGRPEAADHIDVRLDPPDPDAPWPGPTEDTSVFPPPVFPRPAAPVAEAAPWPPTGDTTADATASAIEDPAEPEAPEA